ncbi:uncharacterized protein LOC107362027 [Tetranychus urticae]|uniref:uncharacterized protein LOC107362027 n=1 Tax=Tetranychus urticae TaxID=32264 RepID=UPI000D65BDA7|nr:uncharacterized protein LOC107362027 [Tetranychus urticae]
MLNIGPPSVSMLLEIEKLVLDEISDFTPNQGISLGPAPEGHRDPIAKLLSTRSKRNVSLIQIDNGESCDGDDFDEGEADDCDSGEENDENEDISCKSQKDYDIKVTSDGLRKRKGTKRLVHNNDNLANINNLINTDGVNLELSLDDISDDGCLSPCCQDCRSGLQSPVHIISGLNGESNRHIIASPEMNKFLTHEPPDGCEKVNITRDIKKCKDNHNNERKGEDSQQQQVNIQSMAGTKDKDSDEDDSNETDQMADTLSDKTEPKLINSDSNGDSSDSNGATNSDDDSDGERNKGNLLTSPIQQESTLNEMQTSMMNQLLLGSIGTTLRDVNPLRNPFDEETESSSAYDGNNNESENDKARRLESIMLKGEEDDKDSLLTPSLGSSSSSDGSLSPFPSQDSLDVNEAEISSSSASSSSSPSSPSLSSSTSSSPESTFSAFSSLVDSDNINSLSLRSLIKRLKPFQSAESSSLTSSSSSGSPIMPGSASSLSDAHNHQSIFSQHHLLNLGDANVDSVLSKSMVPLTLTTDLTGSLQQALSSAMSTSSLNSPSLSQSSSSSSSSPNELFNMLSLYQQINDNSMSTAKDDFNLHLFKPLYASNSHSPTFSLSSSSPSTSYRPSSSSTSSNDHKTRTIILPIMSDSLFQSANPFYEALLQSLSSSSSSSSLPSGSTLKLFQDGFTNTNSELSLDGQSNVGELSSLSGVTGTNEMDDSMHSVTLPDSLVGTSFGVKGHPYVVVDEEFNANGIGLPAGYKPDILGILGNANQQNPPCAGISSPDAQSNNGKSEREKEEYKPEKKPPCLLHQPNHYPSSGDQENNRNEDRQPQSHQFHQPREPNRNPSGPDSQTSNDDKDKYHRHRDQDRDHDRDQHRDAQRDQHRDQHRDQYRDQYRDSQQDQYRSQHRNQPQGHHLDDDREPYIPRNRTSFRSIPFIKGAYRYKPDPGYEVV